MGSRWMQEAFRCRSSRRSCTWPANSGAFCGLRRPFKFRRFMWHRKSGCKSWQRQFSASSRSHHHCLLTSLSHSHHLDGRGAASKSCDFTNSSDLTEKKHPISKETTQLSIVAKLPAKCCTPHHDWKPFSHRWVPEERWLPVKDRVVGNRYIFATVGQFDIMHRFDKQRLHALLQKWNAIRLNDKHFTGHNIYKIQAITTLLYIYIRIDLYCYCMLLHNPAPDRNLLEQPNLLDSPGFVLALWTCHSLQSQSCTANHGYNGYDLGKHFETHRNEGKSKEKKHMSNVSETGIVELASALLAFWLCSSVQTRKHLTIPSARYCALLSYTVMK